MRKGRREEDAGEKSKGGERRGREERGGEGMKGEDRHTRRKGRTAKNVSHV